MIGSFTTNYADVAQAAALGASVSGERVQQFYKDFQGELSRIMKTLTTDGEPLVIDGVVIPADQKEGTVASYLLPEWMSRQEFTFSALLDAYKVIQNLENKLNSSI